MSQSAEKAQKELKYALEYGRCPICDGINCEGYPGSCTCCAKCGNSKSRCVCCKYCLETLDICRCEERKAQNWKNHVCGHCPSEYNSDDKEEVSVVHPDGTPCPCCCVKCKKLRGDDCTCCKECNTNPCICCTGCGELRIKCKCWDAKILSHFFKRAAVYHTNHQDLREQFFPRNTAALITVESDDS